VPTFSRRGQESFLDLTQCSEELVHEVEGWKVAVEIESASDHRYIMFDIRRRSVDGGGLRRPTAATAGVKKRGKIDYEVLKEELQRRCASLENPDEKDMEKLLQAAWEKSTPRVHFSSRTRSPSTGGHKKSPTKGGDARVAKEGGARSKMPTKAQGTQRRRRRRDGGGSSEEEEAEAERAAYREARKSLKLLIKRSKERPWKEIWRLRTTSGASVARLS
jgi:hypothetical protein